MSRPLATMIGFSAILIWSFSAWFATRVASLPPLQITLLSFGFAGLFGAARWVANPKLLRNLRQPASVWGIGVFVYCIYHFAYFFAFQAAPAVEATLIAYLWPLLMVLFSALLPQEKLRPHHLLGTALGLLGALLAITQGFSQPLATGLRTGHFIALICALSWSSYSVYSRRWQGVTVDVVSGFCLATALAALPLHLAFETTAPVAPLQWLTLAAMGIGPLGIGFFAWDIGCKRGDIMVLGALSYAGPLLSVLVLLALGASALHWSILAATACVTLGALIAAKDLIRKKGR